MVLPFFSPLHLDFCGCGSGRGEEPGGAKVRPPDSDPFSNVEFRKNLQAGQDKSLAANLTHFSLAKTYGLFNAVCGAGLITSSWALTFCRPAASASICFCWCAMVASCCSFLRCSLRNSLSNIAFTWS